VNPKDLVELGVVRGAYGLKGWVRVAPFASDSNVLQAVRRWWLLSDHSTSGRQVNLEDVRRHTDSLVAKWQGCESKEAADELKGAKIAVPRSEFPPLAEGEHYLTDLIGRRVVNRQSVELGSVSGLRSGKAPVAGVQTLWLEVKRTVDREPGKLDRSSPLLIPLVDQYVDEIEGETVKVDWEADW
jgi:16S rRNA processing protein RimM